LDIHPQSGWAPPWGWPFAPIEVLGTLVTFTGRMLKDPEPSHGSTRLSDDSPEQLQRNAPLDFTVLYDAWFDDVARWLLALGAPSADIEDLAQEVFLVVRRRLGDFDGRNIAGWLYRIASRQVWQHRRRRWIQKVFSMRPSVNIEDIPDQQMGADTTIETKEKRQQLAKIVSRMSEKRRVVFMLFEVEGYSGEEIADTLDVPINTVWTRLHYARKDFFAQLAQHERSARGVKR
jgi:RNA polymerase sigma-70 factor, ECF subfamily